MTSRLGPIAPLLLLVATACGVVRPASMRPGGSLEEAPGEARAYGHFLKAQVALTNKDVDRAITELEGAVAADPQAMLPRMRLARLYLARQRLEESLALCEEILASRPDDLEVLALKGGVLTALGRVDEAIATYSRILEIDPRRQEAYLYLGALYGKNGDNEAATRVLGQLIRRNPASILGYYYLGRIHAGAGNFDEAERYYGEALRLNPQSDMILTDLGVTYELAGKSAKAVRVYQRVLEINPDNTYARKRLGGIYVGQRKLDDALVQYEALGRSEDDSSEAHTKIGLIYFEMGQLERAATEFSLVLATEPDNDRVRYYLGNIYMELGDWQQAVREFGRLEPDSEYFVDGRLRRAFLLQKVRVEDAIEDVEDALDERPGTPELLSYLGNLYREHEEHERAIAIFEDLVTHDPDNDRHHFTLGAAYDEGGRKDDAIECMKRAIELNPRNAAALNYLGYTYADLGVHLTEAEALIRRALDIEPNDGFYVDSLGWVYFKRGEYETAVGHLERAAELAGSDPTIMEHLGDVYLGLGKQGDAMQAYREALARTEETQQRERLTTKIAEVEQVLRETDERP